MKVFMLYLFSDWSVGDVVIQVRDDCVFTIFSKIVEDKTMETECLEIETERTEVSQNGFVHFGTDYTVRIDKFSDLRLDLSNQKVSVECIYQFPNRRGTDKMGSYTSKVPDEGIWNRLTQLLEAGESSTVLRNLCELFLRKVWNHFDWNIGLPESTPDREFLLNTENTYYSIPRPEMVKIVPYADENEAELDPRIQIPHLKDSDHPRDMYQVMIQSGDPPTLMLKPANRACTTTYALEKTLSVHLESIEETIGQLGKDMQMREMRKFLGISLPLRDCLDPTFSFDCPGSGKSLMRNIFEPKSRLMRVRDSEP
jgi:hypothetical protein